MVGAVRHAQLQSTKANVARLQSYAHQAANHPRNALLQPLARANNRSRCKIPATFNPYTSTAENVGGLDHSISQQVGGQASTPVIMSPPRPKRIIVGVTGATGTLFAIRILEVLKSLGIESHLIMSRWALATMKYETSRTEADVRSLATYNYTMKDMSAAPSSGSFLHDGMIIVPCSMKTLAAVRIGFCDDLISRSADVCLKERRRLVLAIRETPLSDIHLENMLSLRKAGAVIFPPVPAFYTRPQTIDDIINQSVGRMLDALDIHTEEFERWTGFKKD